MEIQPDLPEKLQQSPNKSSPTKGTSSGSSTPTASTSKVLIITPEQIAKLGLTQQINKVVQTQVKPKIPVSPAKSEVDPQVLRKKNVRVSKITIINPKLSEDVSSKPFKSEILKTTKAGTSGTLASNEVASTMKNKLSTLLKVHEKSPTDLIIESSSDHGDVKNLAADHEAGRKRKEEHLEVSLLEMSKTSEVNDDSDDDGVILIDTETPVDAKGPPEHHSTKLKNENLQQSMAKLENTKQTHQNVSVIVKKESREQNLVALKSNLTRNLDQDGKGNLPQVRSAVQPIENKTDTAVPRTKIKPIPNILSARVKPQSSTPSAKQNISIQENLTGDAKQTIQVSAQSKEREHNLFKSGLPGNLTDQDGKSNLQLRTVTQPVEIKTDTAIPRTKIKPTPNILNTSRKTSAQLKPENSTPLVKQYNITTLEKLKEKPAEIYVKEIPQLPQKDVAKQTIEVSSQSNFKSSTLPAEGNKISILDQPKEEPQRISIKSEDSRHKIHVLSNEQISLSRTYIASLKLHLPDKSRMSHSAPFFIYKSSNPSSSSDVVDVKPVINLIKEEIVEEPESHVKKENDRELPTAEPEAQHIKQENVCIEDTLIKSETVTNENEIVPISKSFSAVNERSVTNIENLERHFVDKDTIVMVNDPQYSKVLSDSENEEVTIKLEESDPAENLIKSELDITPTPSVIDLTENVEDETLKKKTAKENIVTNRNSAEQGNFQAPEMKFTHIKNFADKIKNKIATMDKEKDLKVTVSKRTYSRKSNLATNSAIIEHSNKNPKFTTTEKLKLQDENSETATLKTGIFVKAETSSVKSINKIDDVIELQSNDEKLVDQEAQEVVKLAPKKRGRKRKSEIIKADIIIEIEDLPEPEVETGVKTEVPHMLKTEILEKAETSSVKGIDENSDAVVNPEANEVVKPTPKKRGRKKKSEIVKEIKIEDNLSELEVETDIIESQDEHNNTIIKHENNDQELLDQEINEVVKPAPKKRGRKKKSEMVKTVEDNVPEPEVETSRRGRKRKVVDYFALAEGEGFDETDSPSVAKKPTRHKTPSLSEHVGEKEGVNNGIVEIDTIISRNPDDDSITCTYSAQEVSPLPKETPKRKRGRPPRIKVIDTSNIQEDSEKISKINSTDIKKTSEGTPTDKQKITRADKEETSEINPINRKQKNENSPADERNPNNTEKTNEVSSSDIEKTNEVGSSDADDTNLSNISTKDSNAMVATESNKKRKRRPRKNEPNATKSLINSIFQHINTSTVESEKDEAAENTNVENTDATGSISTEEAVSVKTELEDSSIETQSTKKQRVTKFKKKRGKRKATFPSKSADKQPTASNDGLSVTCAVCNKEVTKSNWPNHKLRYHNNLTWKVGDPPMDLNDQKFVMSVLSDIYKRRKPLYCEKCGDTKKSVIGFLSHKSMCQKTMEEVSAMRVKCEFCDRSVLPVSMTMHLKLCKGTNNENDADWGSNSSLVQSKDSPVQGKRKAAKKAHSLIKSLKEDGSIETTEGKSKSSRTWFLNFDFRPTYFGKKRFRTEIIKNGVAKCRFEGCQFETSDVDEISNHLYACDKKPSEGYTCKFCITIYKTENDVVEHLQEEHAKSHNPDAITPYEGLSGREDVDDEEGELFEDSDGGKHKNKGPGNRANLMHGIKFLLKHRFCAASTYVVYPPAVDWTLKFCKQNFSVTNVFPNWRTILVNWEKLEPTLIAKYLPHLKYSACTTVIENKKFVDPLKLDHQWKRYKLFEANLENGTSTIFCGGPIFAMAWVPTPYDEANCDQILAVSGNCDINKGYTLNKRYSEPALIQFWNCGRLSNKAPTTEPPKLDFCIAHDYGPVWCLEWCPSGCYDTLPSQEHDSLQRLGVLAVGSANSHIYLYSVCSPRQISGKIFKPKPILKLIADSVIEDTANDLEGHVTTISWSKASGHQYLAAGYANGMVAIYYCNTTSTLLQLGVDQDGIEMIMPYRIFNAHHHAVTVVCLYHLNEGRRWIMTGSIDRSIKYWDLENPSVPITNFTKLIVTEGVWLNHWLSTLQCFDDSCGGGLTHTAVHQPRNFESESSTTMHSNSRVTTITGSDWTNGFVQGNIVGEVMGFFPHQMFYSMEGDKSFRHKKVILGYARLVGKDLSITERVEEEQQKLKKINNKSRHTNSEQLTQINSPPDYPKSEPSTYKEAEEKYGLVFCDMQLHSMKEFPANINSYFQSNKLDKLYVTRPNVYPMQSINKVALNPNRESYLYLATGYQAGFVRISSLQFLNRR